MLRKLSRYMTKKKLKVMASGIFNSKLVYCPPVFGNVFGLDKLSDNNTNSISFTRSDCRQLQVIQNCVSRMVTGDRLGASTADLLSKTGSLSIQQLMAYHTLILTHKIIQTGQPTYLARKLELRPMEGRVLRRIGGRTVMLPDRSLCVSRDGFIYRGAKLFNLLTRSLREETKLQKFKTGVKAWVKTHIPIKP